MCGICGVAAAPGAPPPVRERVERAVEALAHRGPDGSGTYADETCCLGHTRLSIVDLEGGDQPMWNEAGDVVAVFNGEIWNHVELRSELERSGHRFRTRCDTEVLVHGYEEWGDALPTHLDGMFAFAVRDVARRRVLLARDRMGKKPLFVAETPAGLVFGSDLRSVLLAGDLRPELAEEHVAAFLFQRYVTAPDTLVRGVRRLRPGHRATYEDGRLETAPYWRLEPRPAEGLAPADLRALLVEAVRRRLMGDVPVGVLLSGGVDSAAVAGLMREAGAAGVRSFTIGFDDPLHDERPLARLAAEHAETDHHELVVDRDDFVGALPRLAWYRDEPMSEASEVPLLLLAELAGASVKVVLTGDGGDEVFGGYPKYRAERVLGLPGAPAALRAASALAARRPSHRRFRRAADTMAVRDPLLRWASWFRSFPPADAARMLCEPYRRTAGPEALARPLTELVAPYAALDPVRRMLVGDLLTYLPDNMLIRSDKVLMAASVEGRMPLLDHRNVERVTRTPVAQRVGLRRGKTLLREAVADLVPRAVLDGTKRGFTVPVARFMLSDPDRTLERLLLSPRTADRGLFEPAGVRSLVDGHGLHPLDRELRIFTLASLELWLRTNVDEVRVRPPSGFDELLDAEEPAALASRAR